MGDRFFRVEYVQDNVQGFAIFCKATVSRLSTTVKELSMDATYGTNNAGMDLFAVLAEVDGAGIPLAHLFLETVQGDDGSSNARPGAITVVLSRFLQTLRDAGFNPTFFGCDKDFSEIKAIQTTFSSAKIQLCYWHALRAVRAKLKDNGHTESLRKYHPEQAARIVPNLEICWGSMPSKRPVGPHRQGACQCLHRADTLPEEGWAEATSKEDKEMLEYMFARHFNAHPSIPDINGSNRTAASIHTECARELYELCLARGWHRTWAYFWVNWYAPDQWKLWARAAFPSIPVLKTTMILESHWRRVKHDFLHRYNRPRIDLVAWILLHRLYRFYKMRMEALLRGDYRTGKASWRVDFKRIWDI